MVILILSETRLYHQSYFFCLSSIRDCFTPFYFHLLIHISVGCSSFMVLLHGNTRPLSGPDSMLAITLFLFGIMVTV